MLGGCASSSFQKGSHCLLHFSLLCKQVLSVFLDPGHVNFRPSIGRPTAENISNQILHYTIIECWNYELIITFSISWSRSSFVYRAGFRTICIVWITGFEWFEKISRNLLQKRSWWSAGHSLWRPYIVSLKMTLLEISNIDLRKTEWCEGGRAHRCRLGKNPGRRFILLIFGKHCNLWPQLVVYPYARLAYIPLMIIKVLPLTWMYIINRYRVVTMDSSLIAQLSILMS